MMFSGKTWKVFTVGGVPVRVDTSWIIITVFLVWTRWATATDAGVANASAFGQAMLTAGLFSLSILGHEGAHAAMCRLRNIHVEAVTLVMWGGYTTAHTEDKAAKEGFLVAVVGPLASLAIGTVMIAAGDAVGASNQMLGGTVRFIGTVNIMLAVFNMIPGYPMDGGRVLRAIVLGISKNQLTAARVSEASGQIVGGLLMALGVMSFTGQVSSPISGIWAVFLGLMILQSARGSVQRERLKILLEGGLVSDAMSPPPTSIPAAMTLSQALDQYLRGRETEAFPVVEGQRLVGLLSFTSAATVGQHDPMRPVRDAMTGLGEIHTVQEDTPLSQALQELNGRVGLVLRGEDLVGTFGAADVQRYATARAEGIASRAPGPPPLPPAQPGWTPPRPDV
jgi:Zn-dependent protease